MNQLRSFLSMAFVCVLLMAPAPVRAGEGELPQPVVLGTGKVKEILKSDMIMLDNDRRYRLENILVPPYEEAAAQDELKRTFLNRHVTVYSYHEDQESKGAQSQGVPFVQVVTDKNIWLQADIVSKGLAWAFSTETSQGMARALKVVEDLARQQKRGFWSNPMYTIKTPQNVRKYVDTYQIVEGRILSVNTKGSGTTFLNFGKNWQTDFSVRVTGDNRFLSQVKDPRVSKDEGDKRAAKDISEVVFDPRQWENRLVRVRGWVDGNTAPFISITQKEQIDFVDSK
jgi:hypothetical protein